MPYNARQLIHFLANQCYVFFLLVKELLHVILLDDTSEHSARKSAEVAVHIHLLLRLHKTSIVERHLAWITGSTTLEESHSSRFQELCGKLVEYAISDTESLPTRIAALRAMCALTVEDPYIGETIKQCEDALVGLKDMEESSSKDLRKWASRALDVIENEETRMLWSNMITQPIDEEVLKKWVAANGPGDRDLASGNGMLPSYLAELYLGYATKLAQDGPREQDVQILGHYIRQSNTSLPRNAARRRSSPIQLLCNKLLQYTKTSVTAIAAMEEIIALTIEYPNIRRQLRTCEDKGSFLLALKNNLEDTEISNTAARALYAVEKEGVHELWSDIFEGMGWGELQTLWNSLKCVPPSQVEFTDRLAKYTQCLRDDPGSSLLAKQYLQAAMKKSAEDCARHIRELISNDTSYFDNRAENGTNVDESSDLLKSFCGSLLECTTSPCDDTTLLVLEEITALAIESSFVRKLLQDSERICHLKSILKPKDKDTSSTIQSRASAALRAIEDKKIHDLWSQPVSEHEIEHLSSWSIGNEGGRVATLLETLSSGDADTTRLAFRYLDRAIGLAPSRANYETTTSECKGCSLDGAKRASRPRFKVPPKTLLQLALESASPGVLEDLSKHFRDECPREGQEEIGQGGYGTVYKIRMKGEYVAVKKIQLTEGNRQNVIKSFARELRVWAQLHHPNVTTLLGYVVDDDVDDQETDKKFYIVSELELGSLRSADPHAKGVSIPLTTPNQLLKMSLGIAKGMSYLHEKKIVHADLKADNILISKTGEPLLVDFGVSRMEDTVWSASLFTTTRVGTSLRWVAIDYFNAEEGKKFKFNMKTDVWAFGLTLLELLTGLPPYEHVANEGSLMRAIMERSPPVKPEPEYRGPDEALKANILSLCHKCREENPENRISMNDALRDLIQMKYHFGIPYWQ